MYLDFFKRYVDSVDVTKVQSSDITFPSKNCIIYKGKIYMRDGITNDGTLPTENQGIIGEKTWKDQKGGERALKSFITNAGKCVLQLKTIYGWITIYDAMSPTALRIRFETWLDTVSTVIRKRLYFVDGTDAVYQWTGAVATVASIAGGDVTIAGTKTLLQLGFDATGATLPLKIARFTAGVLTEITDYTYTDDCTDKILHLTTTPTLVPQAGDLIIATPIKNTTTLVGTLKDDLYTYKNHLGIGALANNRVYFSNSVTALDYTIPIPTSRTALSPFSIDLTGNYTAMSSRNNILWISNQDDWIKVTKTETQMSNDMWVNIEAFEQPERSGALPFAIAKYKSDLIFLSQDKKLQRITTVELTQRDDLMLLSDEVEDMLLRYDMTECRVYFYSRYIFITLPVESKLLMLDMIGFAEQGVGAFWQPPQTIPISHIQIIDGVRYGHSNARNETFTLFSGGADLKNDIEMVIAFGYISDKNKHEQTQFTRFGLDGRINEQTSVKVDHYFETDGAKRKYDTTVDGAKIRLFDIQDDPSWGNYPWGTRALAGADLVSQSLKRFFVFDKIEAVSWFEYRPTFTILGQNKEFHLLGISLDNDKSTRKVDSTLFISK